MSISDLLTIGICTRNRPAVLQKSLLKTRSAGLAAPTVVYDDASEVPLKVSIPDVKVIRGTQRRGPAFGRNIVIRAASTPFVLFLDDDTYPATVDGLEDVIYRMTSTPRIAAYTFRYVRTYDQASSCPATDDERPCNYILGGASLIRTCSFLSSGGYRESLGFGCEDTELAWRLIGLGYEIWLYPKYVVFHDHVHVDRDLDSEERSYGRNIVLTSSLNLPVPVGILHGCARAASRWRSSARKSQFARGVFNGLVDSWSLRGEATPMSWASWRELVRLAHE